MTDLEALISYLGPDASQWDEDELTGALAAEMVAQRRVIKAGPAAIAPADWPAQGYADLYEALMRRCARNLAMRKLPLGLESTRVGRDPEIRRLEAPHRRLVTG